MSSGCANQQINPETPKKEQKVCGCEPSENQQKACDCEPLRKKQKLRDSDGDDSYDDEDDECGLIVPCLALEDKAEKCILAIEDYNAKNDVKYEFVKVIKANVRIVGGAEYYLTFEAKNATDGRSQVFEALTWKLMMDREVDFCRMESCT